MKTDTLIHRSAEAKLRALGYTPFRQFEPTAATRIGPNEMFEVWQAPNGKLVMVHFYADACGVEFYQPCPGGNSWTDTEAALAAFGANEAVS